MSENTQRTATPAGPSDATEYVPLGFRIAASWAWRLIIVGVAVAAILWMVVQVRIIVIPMLVAILLTALLRPIVDWVMRIGLPKWFGVIVALCTLFVSIGVLTYLVFTRFRNGFGGLRYATIKAMNQLTEWLESGVFGMTFSVERITEFFEEILRNFNSNSAIWSGALEIGTTLGQVLMGALLCIFATIFLLIDGKRIWMWTLGFLPQRAHAGAHAAGLAGWTSVGQYVRVQIIVAFVDALGIGIGAAILQLPLVIPLSILVFLGSFIPFLGAILTGALAAFVALVYAGPGTALIMLGIVVLVNQIESHILQPLIIGNAVRVHPLGVVLAVTTGALVAGIPGALFAVPLVASLNSMVKALSEGTWRGQPSPVKLFHAKEQQVAEVKRRSKLVHQLSRRNRTTEPDPTPMKDDA